MPDTPFKAMGRERRIELRDTFPENWYAGHPDKCEKCGGMVWTGDWPYCRPGHPEDHRRE
jgi:hypothetical protein